MHTTIAHTFCVFFFRVQSLLSPNIEFSMRIWNRAKFCWLFPSNGSDIIAKEKNHEIKCQFHFRDFFVRLGNFGSIHDLIQLLSILKYLDKLGPFDMELNEHDCETLFRWNYSDKCYVCIKSISILETIFLIFRPTLRLMLTKEKRNKCQCIVVLIWTSICLLGLSLAYWTECLQR